ncbi:hypothetical protein [Microcoleus phage My-WqHQDG]|nr:hypothetical protein [Microcoleus phage My-WqHQDG]
MANQVFIMATPVKGGTPPIIGSASELCTELWGRVESRYPRYISTVLRVARGKGEYRGYKLEVVPCKPRVLCERVSGYTADSKYHVSVT